MTVPRKVIPEPHQPEAPLEPKMVPPEPKVAPHKPAAPEPEVPKIKAEPEVPKAVKKTPEAPTPRGKVVNDLHYC